MAGSGQRKIGVGKEDCSQMEIDQNASASFQYFLKKVRELTEEHGG